MIKTKTEMDYLREYNELFFKMEMLLESEWNKQGDHIKKFSLFENTPTPILTNNTYTIAI